MDETPYPWAPRPPSRAEVEDRLAGLLDGRYSRDAVDRWAAQWVAAQGDAKVADDAVWIALTRLYGVDGRQISEGFLISDAEITECLSEFRAASSR